MESLIHSWWEYTMIQQWKTKRAITIQPNKCTLGIYPIEMITHSQKTYTGMFMAALFDIGQKWKQAHRETYHSMGEWLWCTQTTEPHSETKRNEPLIQATTWMNLK